MFYHVLTFLLVFALSRLRRMMVEGTFKGGRDKGDLLYLYIYMYILYGALAILICFDSSQHLGSHSLQ